MLYLTFFDTYPGEASMTIRQYPKIVLSSEREAAAQSGSGP
ncbi:hypothetical protein SAMN04489731_1224 [Amycolatopsis regifaucium]|nr:hypothetical protein SAMN04489731_1224 [Amycolatopsis regifaucium]